MEQTAAAPSETTDLKSLSEEELEAFAAAQGQPGYRGRQLFRWLYDKGARSFGEMTSLPKDFRRRLEAHARIGTLELVDRRTSADETVKALFRLPSGREIETVLIPALDARGEAQRITVCVSSQVGCAMGCRFCATGLMGFRENVPAGLIYEQVREMDRLARERFGRGVSNVVYMGMGEPLLNYDGVLRSIGLLTHEKAHFGLSPRRLTVSTVGLARRIRDFADDDPRCRLAVSLHAPTEAQRSAIMPVNESEKTDLAALEGALRYYHDQTGREVTYEYCLFEDFNDRPEDADRLAEITRWAPSKVNLLMYNPVEGLDFERTTEERLDAFARTLAHQGVTVTVRRSRGQDIDAACGQLKRLSKGD
jgi:23S rRNA (adenine2503-C2)-methyltransferase